MSSLVQTNLSQLVKFVVFIPTWNLRLCRNTHLQNNFIDIGMHLIQIYFRMFDTMINLKPSTKV